MRFKTIKKLTMKLNGKIYQLKLNGIKTGAVFLSLLMLVETLAPTFLQAKSYTININLPVNDKDIWKDESRETLFLHNESQMISENSSIDKNDSISHNLKISNKINSETILIPPGGPDQPEVQSFTPANVENLVDPFTGGFTYNIPLMDVDGYPLNLSYNAGIGMEQEATWVGLGWNLNPGVINRNMRGIPDDFNGNDRITQETNQKTNWTAGLTTGINAELFGLKFLGLSASTSLQYNNYMGFGSTISFGPTFDLSKIAGLQIGLQISGGSQTGASIGGNISFSKDFKDAGFGGKISLGSSFNSRQGLEQLSINTNIFIPDKDRKNTNENSGLNLGTSFNLGMPTYLPRLSHDSYSTSFTGSFKVGPDLMGFDGSGHISGYFSKNSLVDKTKQIPAYGFANLGKGKNDVKGMLDFNRENNGSFTKNTPALPIPYLTYDLFSVSGNGISGSYRIERNDIGYVFDADVNNLSNADQVGVELGFGGINKFGMDIVLTNTQAKSGVWEEGNLAKEKLNFKSASVYNFREANELSYENDNQSFNSIGAEKAVRFKLNNVSEISSKLNDGGNLLTEPQNTKSSFFKQNQPLTSLTVDEINHNLGLTALPNSSYAFGNDIVGHHIGAFLVTKTDGMRYYYGLPAFSKLQKNVSFTIGDVTTHQPNYEKRLVYYSNKEASIENESGIDGGYNAQTIPSYAHSYMLTSVVSEDFIDSDQIPGPSKNDLGSYILFKYKHVDNYKWRNPINEQQANYDLGLFTDKADDKANYIYGEKELWYLDTMITKSHIVIFQKSERNDAVSVKGENGGLDNNGSRMLKLDKIILFSLPEFEKKGMNAVPIKTVHLEYDYSLCNHYAGNINNAGKLTLKKVFITYEKSYRGERTPYIFNYDFNPNYNPNNVDRWGTYKPNPQIVNGLVLGDSLMNANYPYAEQDRNKADLYASAWNLSKIHLPSGGEIEIVYEANDYGFVQHKRAQQMVKIVAVEGDNGAPESGYNFRLDISNSTNKNRKIYFEMLPGTIPTDYAKVGDEIYFRALLKMNNNTDYDFVPGYAIIEQIGEQNGLGFLKFKGAKMKDNGNADYHPFAVAAVQFARNNLSRIIPPSGQSSQAPSESAGLEDIFNAIIGAFSSLGELFTGPNKALWDKNIGNQLVLEKSWVRLHSPKGNKLGGGYRVKKILNTDGWGEMVAGQPTSVYGKEYIYEQNGQTTGVASYEPQIGGEENVWRTAVANNVELKLAPDIRNYMETPFGEQLFPTPSVGYSKVIVKNLDKPGVTRTAMGKIVNEFYTTKDFPTIVQRTDVQSITSNSPTINFLIGSKTTDKLAASQGFYIENNDMNGKPKSVKIYAEDQLTPYSSVEYFYQSEPMVLDNVPVRHLKNNVKSIKSNGQLQNIIVGRTYEAVGDFAESTSKSESGGLGINLNTVFIGIPIPFPMVLPENLSVSKSEFRSAVFAKSVERKGILYKTVARDYQSVVETENLAYDAETGEVLLTSVNNDFKDTVYHFTYPAHWIYEGMGQAYKNLGYSNHSTHHFTNGYCTSLNHITFFPGDELYVRQAGNYLKVWVTESGVQGVRVMKKDGSALNGSINDLKIVRSGRRNLQVTPVGTLTLKKNPLNTLSGNVFDEIIAAEAIEYGDAWKLFCDCEGIPTENPYVEGLKGNWKPKSTYSFLTSRTQAYENQNTNIRKDGVFTSFLPFFRVIGGKWNLYKEGWTNTVEVTQFTPMGHAVETKDPLNRFANEQIGYNQTLTVAKSVNSMKRQTGFNGFEDYDFEYCPDDFFRFGGVDDLTDAFAHSGKYSIKVSTANPIVLEKQIQDSCQQTPPCNKLGEDFINVANRIVYVDVLQADGIDMSYEIIYGNPTPIYETIQGGVRLSFTSSDFEFKVKVILKGQNGCSWSFYIISDKTEQIVSHILN